MRKFAFCILVSGFLASVGLLAAGVIMHGKPPGTWGSERIADYLLIGSMVLLLVTEVIQSALAGEAKK